MRPLICSLALLLIGGAVATAQQPPPYVPTTPNQLRAYDYFLRSPSAYKTFSTGEPGYRIDTVAPYSYSTFSREPSYEHQRVTPRGFERYTIVPGYGGVEVTPFYELQYYVPGYPSHTRSR